MIQLTVQELTKRIQLCQIELDKQSYWKEVYRAKLKALLESQGAHKIESDGLVAKLRKKPGRSSVRVVETEKANQLRQSIAEEQSELECINADALYELEQMQFEMRRTHQVELATLQATHQAAEQELGNEIELLKTNEWVAELKAQLTQELDLNMTVIDEAPPEYVVQVGPKKRRNYAKELNNEQRIRIDKDQTSIGELYGETIPSKDVSYIAKCVIEYSADFEELWRARVDKHTAYWAQRTQAKP